MVRLRRVIGLGSVKYSFTDICPPVVIATLIQMVEKGEITRTNARIALDEIIEHNKLASVDLECLIC